jgi:hypothetical protein
VAEKKDAGDLELSTVALLTKCLAQPDMKAAIALHEKYYLHQYALRDKPLADAKAQIDAHLAEIAKINATVAAARNEKTQLALGDAAAQEAIAKHFAARRAA